MKTEKGETVINCFSQLHLSQLCKLLHSRYLKVPYFETSNNSRTPISLFRFNDVINYKSPTQKIISRPFGRIWSLFPTVQAASQKETGKIFSLEQSEETGMDRLKMMFSPTECGNLSPELHIVVNTVALSLFIGSAIGGTLASRPAVQKLVRQYQASVFNHQFEAKRMFQDRLTILLAGSAFKWAWRLALFSGTYVTIVVGASVYNNKCTLWEHLAAGAFCGSMWKLKMGLPATLVGGGLGSILGLMAGCTSACILWLSGTSVEEMRYWHHDYWEKEYKKQVKKTRENYAIKEGEVLSIAHDKRLEQEQQDSSVVKNDSS